jgi:S-adenosylmethionine hydrolase
LSEGNLRHITLLTDFGTTEGEHTVMKGVIWRILPGAHIADLSHDIAPQNIREAALVLDRTAHYFPPETVHVVVVDPGVGTERRPIAACFGDYFFVGPDNGVCTPLLERAEREDASVEIVHLDKPEYWLENVSPIFHGRDIFAPCAGHLASGVPLAELGSPIGEIVRYHVPRPTLDGDTIRGEVMHIDHFGNLIANIHREEVEPLRPVRIELAGRKIQGLVRAFGERDPGTLVALYSPRDYLMVAVTNGNAAARLGVRVGDMIVVTSQ